MESLTSKEPKRATSLLVSARTQEENIYSATSLPDPLRKEFLTSYLEKIRPRLQTLPEFPDRLMPKFMI